MKTRRKLGWALILAGLLTAALVLVPRGDAFDALGPSLAPEVTGTHWRTWALAGTEAESRRRVEALLANERGWRFVGRTSYANLSQPPNVNVRYFNDVTEDECELWVTYSPRSGERVRVRIDRMTLARHWRNRMGSGPSSTRA